MEGQAQDRQECKSDVVSREDPLYTAITAVSGMAGAAFYRYREVTDRLVAQLCFGEITEVQLWTSWEDVITNLDSELTEALAARVNHIKRPVEPPTVDELPSAGAG